MGDGPDFDLLRRLRRGSPRDRRRCGAARPAARGRPRRRACTDDGGELSTTLSSVVPGTAFEDLNADGALGRARDGGERASRAGFAAHARGETAAGAWEGIVDVADEIDATVIVIGSRGLNGPRELFEGSVSHEVAAHAGRPVLIVPPPGDN